MVPEWLRRQKPTGPEILVYVTLGSFGTFHPGTGAYEECRPSVPTIAEETDLSENTVRKALRGLTEHGALIASAPRYDERGGQLPTVYRLMFGQVSGPPQNLKGGGSEFEGDGVQKNTPGGVPKSEPNQEPSTKNPNTKKTEASPRGTRLPDDWKPSEHLAAWLLGKLPEGRWSDHSRRWAVHETEKFTLYWATKTGRDATKIDWDRTWQKWMLTALERYRPAAVGGAPAGQFKTSAEKQAEKAERDNVKGKLVDELIERGASVTEAVDLAEAELRRREQAGEPIRLDACPVPGYIEATVIDSSRTSAREVTA